MGKKSRLYISGRGAPTADTARNGQIYTNEDGAIATTAYVKVAGSYAPLTNLAQVSAGAGQSFWADVSAAATGEADIILGANLADAQTVRTAALTFEKDVTTTATPGKVWTYTSTAASSSLDLTGKINSADAAYNAADFSAVQLTTGRTSGLVAAVKADCTSLAGDNTTVPYCDFLAAAPTDGGGTVVHSAFYVGAGHDRALDLTACATGEAVVAVADNLAIAFEIKEGSNSYLKLVTTNSAEAIVFGKRIAAAAAANTIADPGGANAAIPVTTSGVCMITTAAAETNTIAIPTFVGQRIHLICDTYAVGNRVITSAQRINQANNTIMTFGAVGDSIVLEGVTIGGALRWQVTANDGVALS